MPAELSRYISICLCSDRISRCFPFSSSRSFRAPLISIENQVVDFISKNGETKRERERERERERKKKRTRKDRGKSNVSLELFDWTRIYHSCEKRIDIIVSIPLFLYRSGQRYRVTVRSLRGPSCCTRHCVCGNLARRE